MSLNHPSELSQILNNFQLTVQSLSLQSSDNSLKSKLQLTQDSLMTKRAANAIVSSIENLVGGLSALKQSILVNDIDALNDRILSRKLDLQAKIDARKLIFREMLSELMEIE